MESPKSSSIHDLGSLKIQFRSFFSEFPYTMHVFILFGIATLLWVLKYFNVEGTEKVPVYVPPIIIAACLLYSIVWLWSKRNTLKIYENGLSYKGEIIAWDAVDNIKTSKLHDASMGLIGTKMMHLGPKGSIKVTANNGKEIIIRGLSTMQKACTLLETRFKAHAFPNALNDIEKGASLEFGDLSVSLKGITYKNKTYEWTAFSYVSIGGAGRHTMNLDLKFVFVNNESRKIIIEPHEIPNFLLAAELCKEIRMRFPYPETDTASHVNPGSEFTSI